MFNNKRVSPEHSHRKLPPKKMMTFYIDRNIAERFRVVADKDGRNYSKVVQNYISRYVESRT
jgi:hypothetical protein